MNKQIDKSEEISTAMLIMMLINTFLLGISLTLCVINQIEIWRLVK